MDRDIIKFDFGWKFISSDVYKAEEPGFDDSKWRDVNLPHDWSIEGPISKFYTLTCVYRSDPAIYGSDANREGKPELQGFFPVGIGWYKKKFTLPKDSGGKKIFIEFEGVYRNSDVWINGHFLGHHKSGYASFFYELTDYLNVEKENVIAVRVDAREKEGWWYEGCGIYRHVWLLIVDKLHIGQWGTFVYTPEVNKSYAIVKVETEIKNENDKPVNCTLITEILDKENRIVGNSVARKNIPQYSGFKLVSEIKLKAPRLWSPEDPFLYKVVSVVKNGNRKVDTYETPLGLRTFCFHENKGFFLNGENIKLRGMCGHQERIPLGSALPDRVIFETMKTFKECGCNFYRSSHNPPAPALLDACDKLGIMVWDENRRLDDTKEGAEDLISMIRRDRNHPCVIIWSMENEEAFESTIEGTKILKNLVQITHKMDPTRPTTIAANHDVNPYGYGDVVDIVSYNYRLWLADLDHQRCPKRKTSIISEYSSNTGFPIYKKIEKFGYQLPTIYELCRICEVGWTSIEERDYLAGGCLWNGFDYLGEVQGWPMIGTPFGIVDLCHLPKDNYYYQSIWTDKPMVYILPRHWNFSEKDFIDVWVYTNCDSVELFLNNKSLGEKKNIKAKCKGTPKDLGDTWNLGANWWSEAQALVTDAHISWQVRFKPGVLKVVARNNGKDICEKEIHTAKKPYKIILTPLWDGIVADEQDVCYIKAEVVDKNGYLVPDANNLISFEARGEGKIIGTANADVFSQEDLKSKKRKCFNGVSVAAVQSTNKAGEIRIMATSPSLCPGEIVFPTDAS